MNIGYEPVSGSYDLTQEGKWLDQLKAAGITCIRNAGYGANPTWAYPLYLLEKQKRFYVEVVVDAMPGSQTSDVVAFATWAQAHDIGQFTIGNEAPKNAGVQSSLASLSCAVRKVYGGTISYDTYLDPSFDEIKAWAANRGCLDKLGLNVYANYANTFKEAQQYLPGSWYLSEFDLDCDYGQCDSDSAWSSGLKSVLSLAEQYPVRINVFAWTAGGDGVNPHWGILDHPQVMAVLGL